MSSPAPNSSPRFTLHPITPLDYPSLTTLHNPFYYLTYPPSLSPELISSYIFASKLLYPEEGTLIRTVKIIDNSSPAKNIVGFATWRFGVLGERKKVERPVGADFTFADHLIEKINAVWGKLVEDDDIELMTMRVSPTYQRQGLGGMLLEWGLKEAREREKRVVLISSPMGRGLYERNGFKSVTEFVIDLGKFGGEGIYTPSAMVWNGERGKGA